MRKFFEFKQKAEAPKSIDLYIYSDVEPNGEDWWTGEEIESDTSAKHFRDELEAAGDVSQINIYINSLGGSVMEGVAIYNQLRRHPANKTVYIDGFACSVASVIAMAGDKVIMPSNATMMVHNPWNIVWGNAAELRKAADDLDKIAESSVQAYLQKAAGKLSAEKAKELLDAETYLTAKECIEYGLADEYAEADIDIEAAIAALEKSVEEAGPKEKCSPYGQKLERIKQAMTCGGAKADNAVKPKQAAIDSFGKTAQDAAVGQAAAGSAEPERAPEQAEPQKEDFSARTEKIINKFFDVKEN